MPYWVFFVALIIHFDYPEDTFRYTSNGQAILLFANAVAWLNTGWEWVDAMGKFGFFLVASFLIVSGSGCGDGSSNKPQQDARVPKRRTPTRPNRIPLVNSHIRFDGDVDADRSQAVLEAMSYLYYSPIQRFDADLKKVLKISNTNSTNLQNWLEARIAFIVDDDYDVVKNATLVEKNYQFENPNEFPGELAESGFSEVVAASGKEIVMENIGAGFYLMAKKVKNLVAVHLSGIGNVNISSPRVGILRIGPGFYSNFKNGNEESLFDTIKIFQLSTLFHEARHSDGHGKSVGFPHAVCPKGHDYQGRWACDRSTNGAYTVGAHAHKALMENCQKCDQKARHELQIVYLDVANRVIRSGTVDADGRETNTSAPTEYNEEPEGVN